MNKILFILYSFVQLIIAQENIGQKEINLEVLRLEQKYQILLDENLKGTLPFYTLGITHDPFASPFENEFLQENNANIDKLNYVTMDKIKGNMRKTFSIYRKGQNKYHLGAISDILGYASAAATAGLAAYHIYKYRKKYGLK